MFEIFLLVLAGVILLLGFMSVKIVPQAEKYVIERLGRLHKVLGPGVSLIFPVIDAVKHKVSVLERQLPNMMQDAITSDNVTVRIETSVFYRVLEPEKTVYRIRDIDQAISTTVAGIVRSEIGMIELDKVQSNRSELIAAIHQSLVEIVSDWGIQVTRAEVLDVNLDAQTRAAMLQQLNAERARRAAVMEAEGQKRSIELRADADLYAAEQAAKARRVQAEADAYATEVVARAIRDNGIEAVQFEIARKQVEALRDIAAGEGRQTVVLPADAVEAFRGAFGMFTGAGR
jgi:regulator of protease activity HflC (stomatin/prohibitin superfamily)